MTNHKNTLVYHVLSCDWHWLLSTILDKEISEGMPPKYVWYWFISILGPLNIDSAQNTVYLLMGWEERNLTSARVTIHRQTGRGPQDSQNGTQIQEGHRIIRNRPAFLKETALWQAWSKNVAFPKWTLGYGGAEQRHSSRSTSWPSSGQFKGEEARRERNGKRWGGSRSYSDSQASGRPNGWLAEKCVHNLLDIDKKLNTLGHRKRYCLPCGLVLLILGLIPGKHPQGQTHSVACSDDISTWLCVELPGQFCPLMKINNSLEISLY